VIGYHVPWRGGSVFSHYWIYLIWQKLPSGYLVNSWFILLPLNSICLTFTVFFASVPIGVVLFSPKISCSLFHCSLLFFTQSSCLSLWIRYKSINTLWEKLRHTLAISKLGCYLTPTVRHNVPCNVDAFVLLRWLRFGSSVTRTMPTINNGTKHHCWISVFVVCWA
jgi:hypothetical protein